MTVVGAGVIGVEYASMFGALGTKVTVVDQRDRVLGFLDGEIGEAFQYLLRRRNVTFRLREKVEAVEALDGRGARLSSPRARRSAPRRCSTRPAARARPKDLGLEHAGLEADKRGRHQGRPRTTAPRCPTSSPSATSPAAGSPRPRWSRAGSPRCTRSTSRCTAAELIPTGIYAIPEIGMVGRTEEELTDAAVPYVAGIARWSELARGADDRRRGRDAQAAGRPRRPPPARRARDRHGAPPSWCTSARP